MLQVPTSGYLKESCPNKIYCDNCGLEHLSKTAQVHFRVSIAFLPARNLKPRLMHLINLQTQTILLTRKLIQRKDLDGMTFIRPQINLLFK